MKNETIKNYQEITVEEAGEMLRENNWEPVEGMALRAGATPWNHVNLKGISVGNGHRKFIGPHQKYWAFCAKVTELNPCKAPDGCPELEPWMAYVGTALFPTSILTPNYSAAHYVCDKIEWICGYGCRTRAHKAIDVRTEWAQEHFPEHCRIRNYQEPNPFSDFIQRKFQKSYFNPSATYYLTGENMKELYELGKANAK